MRLNDVVAEIIGDVMADHPDWSFGKCLDAIMREAWPGRSYCEVLS
jgi:hypothetical protein